MPAELVPTGNELEFAFAQHGPMAVFKIDEEVFNYAPVAFRLHQLHI